MPWLLFATRLRVDRERRQHSRMEQAVAADRSVVLVRGDTLSIGEGPARLLDDHLHGGEVVGLDADGVDGDVDRALGDEAVLPEVAEPARPTRRAEQRDERVHQTE